jgi:hypothetical protein
VARVLRRQPPAASVVRATVVRDPGRSRPDFQFDPELVTEIEVRFEPLCANQTRVDLEHPYFDRFGARAAEMRGIFDSGGVPAAPQGWAGILREFAAVVIAPRER